MFNHNRAARPFGNGGGQQNSDINSILKGLANVAPPKSNSPVRKFYHNTAPLAQAPQAKAPSVSYAQVKNHPSSKVTHETYQEVRTVDSVQQKKSVSQVHSKVSHNQNNQQPAYYQQPQQQKQQQQQVLLQQQQQQQEMLAHQKAQEEAKLKAEQAQAEARARAEAERAKREEEEKRQAAEEARRAQELAEQQARQQQIISPVPSGSSQNSAQAPRQVKFSDENSYHSYTNLPVNNQPPPAVMKKPSNPMPVPGPGKVLGDGAINLAKALGSAADRIEAHCKPQFSMALSNRDAEIGQPAVFEVRVENIYASQIDKVQWFFEGIEIHENPTYDIRVLKLAKQKHTVFTLVLGQFNQQYQGNYSVHLTNSYGTTKSSCYCRAVQFGELTKDPEMIQAVKKAPAVKPVEPKYYPAQPVGAQARTQPPQQQQQQPTQIANTNPKIAGLYGKPGLSEVGYGYKVPQLPTGQGQQVIGGSQFPMNHQNNTGAPPNVKVWSPNDSHVMQSLNSGNAPDQRMKVGRTQAQLNNMF